MYRFAFLLLALLPGCSSGPRMHEVSGAVTFDGAPVPDGEIAFIPKDRQYGPDAARIKDGQFKLLVKEGSHQVEIHAARLVKLPPGQKGPMGESELMRHYIPARYNAQTELSADITGPAELQFPLKSR